MKTKFFPLVVCLLLAVCTGCNNQEPVGGTVPVVFSRVDNSSNSIQWNDTVYVILPYFIKCYDVGDEIGTCPNFYSDTSYLIPTVYAINGDDEHTFIFMDAFNFSALMMDASCKHPSILYSDIKSCTYTVTLEDDTQKQVTTDGTDQLISNLHDCYKNDIMVSFIGYYFERVPMQVDFVDYNGIYSYEATLHILDNGDCYVYISNWKNEGSECYYGPVWYGSDGNVLETLQSP